MAQLNYTLENVPITVLPNGTWVQKDVPRVYDEVSLGETSAGFSAVADGIIDDGLVPLVVKIFPINVMEYSVCSDNFTIGGIGPVITEDIQSNTIVPENGTDLNAIDCVSRTHTWLSSQVGLILPDGVIKVTLHDLKEYGSFINQDASCSSYNQRVGIGKNGVFGLIYLDPDYQLGNEDIDFKIDFDGDATPLCGQFPFINTDAITNVNSNVNTAIPQPIRIVLELVGEQIAGSVPTAYNNTPNCVVVPYLWDYSVNQSYTGIVNDQISNMSDIKFSPPILQIFEDGMSMIYSPDQVDTFGNVYKPLLFYIIPDVGYKLSRNMLLPKSTNSGGLIEVDGVQQTANVNYEMFKLPTQPQMDTTPMAIGPTESTYGTFPPNNMVFDNYYPSTLWNNINVLVDGVSTPYNDLNFNQSTSDSSTQSLGFLSGDGFTQTAAELYLIDTISPNNSQYFNVDANGNAGDNLGVYGEGYNFGTTGGAAGTIPDNYCPSDFDGNAVLVGINMLERFKPGENGYPSELRIQIKGAAVIDDGSECFDGNIQIDECTDGIDSEGNQC
jgi:hypothetical protein|tara:strand:+ start:9535 stop:11199 length:1665 start_codon:yes stop_codon:yes gene_type:complete